jgi:plastocyanin
MKIIEIRISAIVFGLLTCANLLSSSLVAHAQWHNTAGAQSNDKGTQALAFLPNEIWIHSGDSVTWTFATDEPHSVTFLKPGQTRPTIDVGCPGATTTGKNFDGSGCVNSGRSVTKGQTYTVTFPTPGNYRLVCLVHVNMTGIVHVLDPWVPLPHDQDFYEDQATKQGHNLLSDVESARGSGGGTTKDDDSQSASAHTHSNEVVTGGGELVSTAGGIDSASRMRFMQHTTTIHVGETVEWFSDDVTGHTITFGQEPPNVTPATPPSTNVSVDVDGARHATISSPSDNVHSGFIAPAPQERTGLAQSPAGVTRFRVTFTHPGTFPYICAFHDDVGMKGEVIVLP